MGIKNLVVNKPAFFLTEDAYFKYIKMLSTLLSLSGRFSRIKSEQVQSISNNGVVLWKLNLRNTEILIQSKYRISRFLKGFDFAGERQWVRYGIPGLLQGEVPDALIDIGANIGEVSGYASKIGIPQVFAIEPDPIVYECLQFNMSSKAINLEKLAIGENDGEVIFYSQPHSADSSFFKPVGDFHEILVQSMTLDTFFQSRDVVGNVLFKMDAEGFEPEVLKSGPNALSKIKWVAIDAGAERGQDSTASEVVEILKRAGFVDIAVSDQKIVMARR